MKVSDYLRKSSYKYIFNQLQKEFYPRDSFENDEIISKDMFFYRLYASLNSLTEKKLDDHKLYVTQFSDKLEKVDICILDEKEDALIPLDFFSCSEILSLQVLKTFNIEESTWLAFLLYKICYFKVPLDK